MHIIDRKDIVKNVAKLTKSMDNKIFGVYYPSQKKEDPIDKKLNEWFNYDNSKGNWFFRRK